MAVLSLVLLATSVAVLVFVDALWVQLFNAVFLAFVFTQIGFLGHDVGHRQVFASARRHRMFEPIIGGILGMSQTWWIEKHKRHHANPNAPDSTRTRPYRCWPFPKSRRSRSTAPCAG